MTSNLAGVNYELFAWEERLHAAGPDTVMAPRPLDNGH